MARQIFYCWQSDLPGATNRSLLQAALEIAINELRKEDLTLEAVLDRDTAGVAGAPEIASTIFSKIQNCEVFVADVSIINAAAEGARPTPNPNVLVELGYALGTIGSGRVILLMNKHFGLSEKLPFDLRMRRTVQYESDPADQDRATARKELAGRLKTELKLILERALPATPTKPEYLMTYRFTWHPTRVESNVHEYLMTFYVKNEGSRRATDYRLEVGFPTTYLYDTDKGDGYRRFVFNQDQYRGSAQQIIYPDEEREAFRISYYVDTRNFSARKMNETMVRIALYSGDMPPRKEEIPISDLQNF